MGITYGGQSCLDPLSLHDQCVPPFPCDASHVLPIVDWFDRCNRFQYAVGEAPGTGSLLLPRFALDKLNLNASYDLVFDDAAGGKITFHNISVTEARCVTPGLRGDKAAAWLVEVADRRELLRLIPVDRAYNVLQSDGSDYADATLNEGDPWSWQEVVDNLKAVLGLTGFLTLPFEPDGVPENLSFYGGYAWAALNAVVRACGCVIQFDPTADLIDEIFIVEVGADDAEGDTALQQADRLRTWDYEFRPLTLTRAPAKVRVRFRRFPTPDDSSTPFYYVEQSPPATMTTAVAAGSVVWLDGGLAARCDGDNAVTNVTDLTSRAVERSEEYYQSLLVGADPLNRVYSGLATALTVYPGAKIKAVVVQDVGSGYKTEVYRGLAVEPPITDQGIILPAVASTGTGRRARVTDEPTDVDGADIYDAVLDLYDDPTAAFVDGSAIWLRQRKGVDLSTDGTGVYLGLLEDPAFAVEDDTRPLYVTNDRPYAVNVECVDGEIVVSYDGPPSTGIGAGLRYMGVFDDAVAYTPGQVVLWESTYVAIAPVPAGNPPPDPAYWAPLTLDFVAAETNAIAPANVTPDVAYSSGVSTANAAKITTALAKGAGEMRLPRGKTYTAQLVLDPSHSGMVLDFADATLVNALGVTSADGRVLVIDSECNGYADEIGSVTSTTFEVFTADISKYTAGTVVFLWAFNTADGVCERHVIASMAGTTATVAETIVNTGTVDHVKWVKDGKLVSSDTSITLTMGSAPDAANFLPDGWYILTDGIGSQVNKSYNELHCEWVQVAGVSGAVITLKFHRRNDLESSRLTLLPGPYIERLTIRNANISSPSYPYDAILLKSCRDITIENTAMVAAGEIAGQVFIIEAAAVDTLRLINYHGGLDFNACYNLTWTGGSSTNCGFNELSRGALVTNVRFGGFLNANSGAREITFRACDMDAVGSGVVFDGDCHDLAMIDCLFHGVYYTANGDRFRLENPRGTGTFELHGLDHQLVNTGAITFLFWTASTGLANNVPFANIADGSGTGAGGGWHQLLPINVVGPQTLSLASAGATYTSSEQTLLNQIAAGLLAQGILLPFEPSLLGGVYAAAVAGVNDLQTTGGSPATADTDPVGFVTDTTVNGNSPTSSGGGRPTLKTGIVNSQPVWRLNGSNYLLFPLNTDGVSFSYFMVVRPTAFAAQQALFGAQSSGRLWSITTGGKQRLEYQGISTLATSTTTLSTSNFSIIGVTYDNGTGDVVFWLNGATDGTATITPVSFGNNPAYMGDIYGGGKQLTGDIAAYVKVVGVLSGDDVAKLNAYLNGLYGVY